MSFEAEGEDGGTYEEDRYDPNTLKAIVNAFGTIYTCSRVYRF